MRLSWKCGIFAGLILAIFMLYPQGRMIYLLGDNWHGNYAITDVDEVAYAAYLQSLIDGKPRKNDSYAKVDDTPEHQQGESLFSIQFASAYAVAIPARIFGFSAGSALVITGVLSAFFSGLVLFWLIGIVTRNSFYALAGSLVVLCCGALAGGEGAILEILGTRIAGPFFPGFRRYIPSVAFPIFFGILGVFWLLVKTTDEKRRFWYGVFAFFAFGFIVFSYFYLWATLVAWFVCVAVLWLIGRPEGWIKDSKAFLKVGFACLIWFIPYGILLANRSATNDEVQLLEYSHTPNFARVPEYIGLLVLSLLAILVLRKRTNLKDKATLFAASFAIVPIAVHNQQIITGKSLQSVHFDLFTVNYLAILGLILVIWQWKKDGAFFESFSGRSFIGFGIILVLFWGLIECHFSLRILDPINIERDEGFRVAKRLKEIGNNESGSPRTVMAFSIWEGDDLPTLTTQPVLWSLHQIVFGSISVQESKNRYYQQMYYQNINAEQLRNEIKKGKFAPIIALFGWGRYSNRLSLNFKSITDCEIDEEVARFDRFTADFNPKNSAESILSYLVVSNRRETDLSNIDKWYERNRLENLDGYSLHELVLKTPK
jgi:hypothetical protein